MKVNVDFITKDAVHGDVAARIMQENKLNPGVLRPYIGNDGRAYVTIFKGGDPKKISSYQVVPVTNATLRRDEWKQLDEAIMPIAESRLTGAQDLISRGLTYQLGNALGTTVLEWHDISDAMEAELTMDGVTRSKGDRVSFGHNYLPIPIVHVDYEINSRALEASRRLGNPLDTSYAERAARKVQEKIEEMLFTDTTYSFGEKDSRTRNTIYSYVNHPDRNTVSLSENWDAAGKTGAEIIDDVIAMKQASIDSHYYGPWVLYVPTSYETVLDKDYDSTTPGTTIRERILKIDRIEAVKVIDKLADDNVLLVQMTSDVARMVMGLPIQNVQWKEEGMFVSKFKVLTIQVPQIRSDQSGNTGIVHLA